MIDIRDQNDIIWWSREELIAEVERLKAALRELGKMDCYPGEASEMITKMATIARAALEGK